jgi:hypothetical protein
MQQQQQQQPLLVLLLLRGSGCCCCEGNRETDQEQARQSDGCCWSWKSWSAGDVFQFYYIPALKVPLILFLVLVNYIS